jgi:signal transduction histidine kinase
MVHLDSLLPVPASPVQAIFRAKGTRALGKSGGSHWSRLALIGLFGLCFLGPLSAQTPRCEARREVYYQSAESRQRLEALLLLAQDYQSLHADSIYAYGLEARRLYRQLPRPERDAVLAGRCALVLARSYLVWGWVDSALAVAEPLLAELDPAREGERVLWYETKRLEALCHGGVSRFPEALEGLYAVVERARLHGDSLHLAYAANTIGSVHLSMGKQGEGLQWMKQAAASINGHPRYADVRAANLTNQAYAYLLAGAIDSAASWLDRALPAAQTAQNLNTEAIALRLTSIIAQQQGDLERAETALLDMLALRGKLQSSLNLLQDNLALANFYAATGKIDQAIQVCLTNLQATEKAGGGRTNTTNANLRMEYYAALAGFYQQAGQQENYVRTLERLVAAKDSFYLANSAEALAEWQARYELTEKENLILRQRVNLTRKNLQLYGGAGLVALLGGVALWRFLRYRRAQQEALRRTREEEQAAAARAVQEAGERERRRIAADLHDNLGVQANAILYNTELLHQDSSARDTLLEDLRETARQMLRNLRETLWAMRTRDVPAGEWWLRVIGFCQQMNRMYAPLSVVAEGRLPEGMVLPAERALHLVLVVQEAVQNAVRHAQAQQVRVVSEWDGAAWKLHIEDDGIGFDPLQSGREEGGHYGLVNMRERAEAAGLSWQVDSQPGQGTRISLTWLGDYPNGPLSDAPAVATFDQQLP